MNGRRVFKFGVNAICDTVNKLACDASIAVEDIDHFVFHQANERILSQAVKRLGVPDDRVVRTLRETGNISSACIPLCSRSTGKYRRAAQRATPSPWSDLAPAWM